MTRGYVIGGIAAALLGVFSVWFAGFSLLWAVATVFVVGAVGIVVATRTFDEPARWAPPAGDTPRGVRLAVTTIEQSLAACDRLARPPLVRRLRALIVAERDERPAREMVRRMHALMGSDADAMLEPRGGGPVTSATIERCLDALERQSLTPPRSS